MKDLGFFEDGISIDDFIMSDIDLDFDNNEIFNTLNLQTEGFENGPSSCSSMGQSISLLSSSSHMETILPDNTMDSESVSISSPCL